MSKVTTEDAFTTKVDSCIPCTHPSSLCITQSQHQLNSCALYTLRDLPCRFMDRSRFLISYYFPHVYFHLGVSFFLSQVYFIRISFLHRHLHDITTLILFHEFSLCLPHSPFFLFNESHEILIPIVSLPSLLTTGGSRVDLKKPPFTCVFWSFLVTYIRMILQLSTV